MEMRISGDSLRAQSKAGSRWIQQNAVQSSKTLERILDKYSLKFSLQFGLERFLMILVAIERKQRLLQANARFCNSRPTRLGSIKTIQTCV